METISPALASAKVLDESNAEHPLADAWRDKTAVITWVRQFGCVFCREQAAELQKLKDDFAKKNAHLVVVGNGAPVFIKAFRKAAGFEGELYTDPKLDTYKAATWRPGSLVASLDPRVVWAAVKAMAKGYFQGQTQGDKYQLGGVLVVRPSGEVAFRYASRYAGDHPSNASVLAAV